MTFLRPASALGLVLIFLAIAGSHSLDAQAGETWDGNGGDNDWTTNNNWTPNGEPPNDGTANIVMAGTNRLMPNVDVDWDIRSLVFSNTAGAFALFGGSGVTLGVGEGGIVNQDAQTQIVLVPVDLNASQTWSASQGQLNVVGAITGHVLLPRTLTLSGSSNMQISGGITGAVTVNKTGSGTLTFNSVTTNAYAGPTTVSAGTLVLNRTGGANRAIPGNLTVGDGFGGAGSDIVRLDSSEQISEAAANTVTISNSGQLSLNGFNETLANLTLNGGSVSGAGTLTVNGATNTGTSTASVISSTMAGGGVTIGGAGTLTLSGSAHNLFTGPMTINGGTVLLHKTGGAYALGSLSNQQVTIGDGSGSDVVRLMADGQIPEYNSLAIESSGLLDLNGFNQKFFGINIEGGSITTGGGLLSFVPGSGMHTLAASQTATITGNLGSVNTMLVDDGPPADDLLITGSLNNLPKSGAGQVRLIGTVSGVTNVFGGRLILAGTLPTSGIGGASIGGIGSAIVLATNEQISASASDAIIIQSGGTLDLAGFDETINDLELIGGTVTPNGGTLVARNLVLRGGTLNPADGLVRINGNITVLAPAAAGSLIAGNVDLAAANLSINVADGVAAIDLEIALPFEGESLTKLGAGTLLLSGAANTYAGATTVSAGVLTLNKSGVDRAVLGDLSVSNAVVRLAADEQIASNGAVTFTSSTFDLNGFQETIGGMSLDNSSIATGAGTLVVTGNIEQGASGTTSITGRLDLGGATRTITSSDSTAAIDLDIAAQLISGGIIKNGSGTWRLSGNNTFSGGVHHQNGKLLIAHNNALATGTLTLGNGTAVEADGGARQISNAVVVVSLATIGGSDDLTLVGPFTTNLGSTVLKNSTGALTIAGPRSHAAGSTLIANAGTTNFDSSATGATLSVNLGGADPVVNFNAPQELNTLAVNGGHARVGDTTLLSASSLSIGADATLELEIGGVIAGNEFAKVLVSGNAALAGDLEITLVNGFSPTVGNSFDVLDWGSLTGTFSSLTLPPLGGLLAWNTSQLYTTGVLSVASAPTFSADFDVDGDVDGEDLAQWQGDFGANALSDADDDGDSDGADFLAWQRQLGSGSAGASPSQATVPEPSGGVLALVMLGGATGAMRRCSFLAAPSAAR